MKSLFVFFTRSMSAFALLFVLSLSIGAMAAEKGSASKAMDHATMTPEMKKDASEMYQKMADCLKTDKSMKECQKDVMANCPVAKANGGHCPLMDGMKGMPGMKKGMKMDGKMKDGMKGMEMEKSEHQE